MAVYEDGENKYTSEYLRELRALPLERKVLLTQSRIMEWYKHFKGNVYVSFSGGKDSTVLLYLARQLYPDIRGVFSNTGLEYPEIQAFVRKQENIDIIRPKMSFRDVLMTYGYPLISKEVAHSIVYARSSSEKCRRATENARKEMLGIRTYDEVQYSEADGTEIVQARKSRFNKEKWLPLCMETPFRISAYCCNVIKKSPMASYEWLHGRCKPLIATLTEESQLRRQAWLKHGCNAFDGAKQTSQPMSFWTEQDVLHFIQDQGLEIASVYGEIEEMGPCGKLKCSKCDRTGCIFCGFGMHLEKGPSRFEVLAETHPRQYEYCMEGGQWVDNPDYDPTYTGEKDEMGWELWNPKKLWVPSDDGLGMRRVFEIYNSLYEERAIQYE